MQTSTIDLKKSLEIASNNVVSLADTLIKELQYRQNIEKVTERLLDAALVVGDALQDIAGAGHEVYLNELWSAIDEYRSTKENNK